MAKIKGYWKWDEDYSAGEWLPGGKQYKWKCNFASNGQAFTEIKTSVSTSVQVIDYVGNGGSVSVRDWFAQEDENGYIPFVTWKTDYMIMNFGMTEQEIDDELYEFITEHAHYVEVSVKLTMIAENEQRVYDKGKAEGYQDGLVSSEAYKKGKQAEYDAFWDAYQVNGNRGVYEAAFAGQGWNDKTFNPKYPIVVTGSSWNMFYSCNVKDGYEHFKNIDFSKCTLLNNTFAQCHMKHLGTIDCRNVKSVSQVFYHAKSLQTIDKIIVKVENTFSSLFDNAPLLENVTFEGEIGNNLVMAGTYSGTKWGEKLTRASIESIINHLSDNVSGKTLTLSKNAVNATFGDEWDSYVTAHKPSGWNITLAS